MKNWPGLENPPRYQGLYVFDAGTWSALGYTAEEIAILLESPEHRGGRVYKIHRATPDGILELRSVSPERFQLESGIFFYRNALPSAQEDFETLCAAAERSRPPCRSFVHLTDRSDRVETGRYVTALIHPAEHEEEIGQWLARIGFEGGDWAEGGVSHVSNYYAESTTILQRAQLWSQPAIPSRTAQEILASVRRAVQR